MADLTEYPPKSTARPAQLRSAFGPFFLVALSLITILAWQVLLVSQTHEQGLLLQKQRTKLVEQSRTVQTRLQKFLRGLIDLSATDQDAKAIVTKFDISLDQSGVSTQSSPAPAVQTSPAPSAKRLSREAGENLDRIAPILTGPVLQKATPKGFASGRSAAIDPRLH